MNDPTSGTRDPVTARFPMGCLEDLHLARIGRPLWSASSITAGTLVVLKGATHFAQFEAGRSELVEPVDTLLRDANRESHDRGW